MFYHALIGRPKPIEDLEPVLLWSNPSPTTGFAAQTVSLDLTDYAGVIIEFHQSDTASFGTRTYIKKNDNINGITGAGYPGRLHSELLARNVTVTNSGVVFGVGIPNPGDIDCVPNRIYGVKKYVVEPADSISISSAKEFTTAGIDCQIGEYYQLMSNSGTQAFDGLSGADVLIKFSSSGAYTVICKATSTHINVGSTTSGSYCQIILNK